MTNQNIKAGTVIYEGQKDKVASLDVIVKGKVKASGDYCTIDLPAGSIIGIGELPGEEYIFTYEAYEDTMIYSYTYESEASLVTLFKTNPKLLGTLVAASVRFAKNMQSAVLDTMEFARTEYASMKKALEEYPTLAANAGVSPKKFPDLEALNPPEMLDKAKGWHRDFVEDLSANEAKFRSDLYAIPSIGLGIGLTVNSYALESREFMSEVIAYINNFTEVTKPFKNHSMLMKEKAEALTHAGTDALANNTDESVRDCLGTIHEFAMVDDDVYNDFSALLHEFIPNPDRYGNDDVSRKLRRELANKFYDIYLAVFLRALELDWKEIPLGIRMFLLFGYVDETLAGADNTAHLAGIADTIEFQPDSRVLTAFEWLKLIAEGKVVPSKNEFDLDYPAFLREQKRSGEITEEQEKKLADSLIDKLKFEVKNMFMIGNRTTFGRIATFVPVFDKENVIRTLDQIYLNAAKVNNEIERIRSIDFTAFCRQGLVSLPEAGVNSFYTDDEILPYIILMPNVGSRATLWQEIDSKRRNTPARMILSIFHTESFEDTMLRLVGEFRWEMCKTEQGVHWNDVSDPSITSLYCDYLQFYRKNSALSADAKEKLSMSLKNNANNFRKVFVADYLIYMKYESQRAIRLNKIAREILFKFCPFGKETIKGLSDNPQYSQLITKFEAETKQKQKTLSNLCVKIEKAGCEVPEKIKEQIKLWS